MNLAVSNIAWSVAGDSEVHELLLSHGIHSLELAPTRWWPDMREVTEKQARSRAEELKAVGLQPVAFQALMFGRPEVQLFGADGGSAMLEHLSMMCEVAGWMGARALVFGSPRNRIRGGIPLDEANDRAVEVFRRAGESAVRFGVVLCLEPNPEVYGGDYLTTTREMLELVRRVDSPGIALNFDMGTVQINGDVATELIELAAHDIGHFHASEPMLAPFEGAAGGEVLDSLHSIGYKGTVSLEMKALAGGVAELAASIAKFREVYGRV